MHQPAPKNEPERILSWAQLRPLIGNASRSTVWRWIKAGKFPAAVRMGSARVGWRASEIAEWQANL